jgi:putative heme-binding domain-containing protein
VIPGGIYQRQGGQHFNPYVYGDIETIADHRHRSAHGGARVYQSDAFPASQQGRIFMANIHEHAVLSDVLVRKGSGFTAHHGDDFMMANNAQWIGFSLEVGPEGALYVLDWHDADICGQEVLHQETGRIFRIAPAKSLAESFDGRYSDLKKMNDARLVELQTSRSDWHARRARVILQERAVARKLDADTHERLRRIFRSDSNQDWRLRAMWALHVTGGWTPSTLTAALQDPNEYIRAWAVQLLTEDGSPSRDVLNLFVRMAREDRSAVVRLYLASALQRIDGGSKWSVASALMAHAEDAADHNVPKMVWVGIEPLVAENPSVALGHASASALPLVARFIARRAVDADAIEPVVAAIAKNPAAQASLLEGMRDGLEGRFDLTAPAGWAPLYERLKGSDPAIARLAGQVAQQFGDTEAARRNLATIRSRTAPADERRAALQTLTAQRRPQLAAELPAILADDTLRIDGIRSIAAFDQDALGKLVIDRYKMLSAAEKAEALQTMSSRRRYGLLLTDAIAKQIVPRRDVPVHVARQLRRVVGSGFTDVWGPIEQNAAEERTFARYRTLLTDSAVAAANVRNGHTLFQRTCAPCHKMYGEGGTLGPDITGANRGNLDYLLFNVLNPNGEVQDAYKMVVITTRDGRSLSGNVASETPRQVTLRVVGQDAVVINKSDIQSRESTNVSMMPPGLLDPLTDREVVDLMAYLRIVEPVK